METKQLRPGMITQMQRTCDECNGIGHTAKTKNERKVIEVHVEKGASHNQRVTFRGLADETPGCDETGDVNIIIQEKEHHFFKRKGADLLITKTISLKQALCGYTLRFNHLDGRDVVIKTKPGEVIQSGESTTGMPYTMMVPNEGMPSRGNPFVKGNLYVSFSIQFPKKLDKDVVEKLRDLLPDDNANNNGMEEEKDNNDDNDYDANMEVEEHYLEEADPRHFGKGGAAMSGMNEYDTDDEEMNGQNPVQCQQS